MIGTSTNLLVDGVAREAGLEPFTLFEITPLGIVLVAFGLIYLILVAPRLLPDRSSLGELMRDRGRMRFVTEAVVPDGSPLVGLQVADCEFFRRARIRVVDLFRDDRSMRDDLHDTIMQAGDRLVLRMPAAEVLGMSESREIKLAEESRPREATTVEALISPGCRMVGTSLGALDLGRRHGVYVIAVHRPTERNIRQLDSVVVRVGDTLLLDGPIGQNPCPGRQFRFGANRRTVGASLPAGQGSDRHRRPRPLGHSGGGRRDAALCAQPVRGRRRPADPMHRFRGSLFLHQRTVAGPDLVHAGARGRDDRNRGRRPDRRAAAPALAGLPPVLIVWGRVRHHLAAHRAGVQQCGGGCRDAGRDRPGSELGYRSATARGHRDGRSLGKFCHPDRLPDQHPRLRDRAATGLRTT